MKTKPAPKIIMRHLWRNPTKSEIRFGHGCIHHTMERVPVPEGRTWVMLPDGLRWYVHR